MFRYNSIESFEKLHHYSLEIPKQIALYSSILLMLLMCWQFIPGTDKKPTITKTNVQKTAKKKDAKPIAANKSDDYKLFLFTLFMTVVCGGESYFLRMYYRKYNEFLVGEEEVVEKLAEDTEQKEQG